MPAPWRVECGLANRVTENVLASVGSWRVAGIANVLWVHRQAPRMGWRQGCPREGGGTLSNKKSTFTCGGVCVVSLTGLRDEVSAP